MQWNPQVPLNPMIGKYDIYIGGNKYVQNGYKNFTGDISGVSVRGLVGVCGSRWGGVLTWAF